MKVFVVFAHPDIRSYNGSLLKVMTSHLTSQGHEVKVSDLYKEKFKTNVDEDDFLNFEKGSRLKIIDASMDAAAENALTDDVKKAQENLLWADFIIFQFPLWWYSVPAILKGWFDRVFSGGFAYGIPNDDGMGDGILRGKKAMLLTTVGVRGEPYGPRGINGPMTDLLFPITHGTLFFVGLTVYPSFCIYHVDHATQETFERDSIKLMDTLDNIDSIKPIPFRKQTREEYTYPGLVLKEGVETPGARGFELQLTG
ncbi:NAD(P)H-dependent oxidoreductase KNAG_0E00950 [Huiozyma naganishii CBS 8797]|uniref:Flavodoxin-like fold domain-containing protein n=1 Tax=Huiozyma naganishii (strain ATCC MYA-139 / BCRC 22969 / CBS 8797 / KCTC 17520 / NBRC 10181 / NCYC 3082 / Yp74L-3) TaxID=1071383 RepID=J7RLF9_HUIN7|nr:hypothetical protein KNAG_0E00950 [Kazachstania naganishii CBS 8797]CCK70363.1 hypothetical protein KNAG_0E00950 [Kazachstania naganishii CBS 8797]